MADSAINFCQLLVCYAVKNKMPESWDQSLEVEHNDNRELVVKSGLVRLITKFSVYSRSNRTRFSHKQKQNWAHPNFLQSKF